jgi:hypothetical protein
MQLDQLLDQLLDWLLDWGPRTLKDTRGSDESTESVRR